MKLWIARDYDGRLYVHSIKPFLIQSNRIDAPWWDNEDDNFLRLKDESFPEVTFENSPMEVELKLIEK